MLKLLASSKRSGMVLIAVGMLFSACTPEASAHNMYATLCHPPTLEGNVYRQDPQEILNSFYVDAFSHFGDDAYFKSVQYEAIRLLATQTERWSDFIDIPLETKYVRVTITYLSPELVQTIILNHYLFRKNGSYINGDFKAQMLSQMESIANRNEHLFFVTLTASSYEQDTSYTDPVIVQLPMQSLMLTSSSGTRVIPQHYDHHLEDRVDLTFTSAHGYLAFPMAIEENGNCEYLLDKTNNPHIILSIPHIVVNSTNHTTMPWMLDYVPLLSIAPDPNPLEDRLLVERNAEDFSPCKDLPLSIDPEDAEYWKHLARFIWHEMTLDP